MAKKNPLRKKTSGEKKFANIDRLVKKLNSISLPENFESHIYRNPISNKKDIKIISAKNIN